MIRSIAALLLVAGFAAPAFAAPPTQQELRCIYDRLNEESVVKLAKTVMDAVPAEERKKLKDEVSDDLLLARAPCELKYRWTPQKGNVAESIAMYTAVRDVLLSDLLANGLKNTDIMSAAWDKIGRDGQRRLLNKDWVKDEKFSLSVRDALLGAGFPNEVEKLADAATILEASARASYWGTQWPAK